MGRLLNRLGCKKNTVAQISAEKNTFQGKSLNKRNRHSLLLDNKPGSAQFGAISKAQKSKSLIVLKP